MTLHSTARRTLLAASLALAALAVTTTPDTLAATSTPRTSYASVAAQRCADVDAGWTELDRDSPRILQWADIHSARDGFWIKSVSYKFVAIREDGDKKTYTGTKPGNDDGGWLKSVDTRVDWGRIKLTYEFPKIKLTNGSSDSVCRQGKITETLER